MIVILIWAGFAFFGRWVAGQKRRSKAEGFVLGLVLGPFGVLIEALLPSPPVSAPIRRSRRRATSDWPGDFEDEVSGKASRDDPDEEAAYRHLRDMD